MAEYVGGLRARLIKDSVYHTVHAAMADLGWFTPGRQHQTVTMIPEPVENDVEIKPNLISLSDESNSSLDMEIGSNLAQQNWDFIFDVYAEDSQLGLQMAVDIRDILAGRFSSIGRSAPVIQVYDYTQTTPTPIFKCDLENISHDKQRVTNKSWQRHWFVVFFTVVDQYENDA